MDQESKEPPARKSSCPQCGADGLPVVYGYPGDEMREGAARGDFVLGGCVIDASNPTHCCPVCDARWSSH